VLTVIVWRDGLSPPLQIQPVHQQPANGYNPLEHLHIMPSSGRAVDDEVSDFGVTTVGTIDSEMVKRVQVLVGSAQVKQRHHRQTELKWNSECDAVVSDFEAVSEKDQRDLYCPNGMIETQTEH
jgi:hypothetical protein